jgi:RNA polymerase sigma-70 factor (ECF subfamily)
MEAEQFRLLMERVRSGETEAMGDLLRHFEQEVRIVVRQKLPRRLRVRYDSMDFVQSVYQSIMADWRTEPPERFESPEKVLAYLSTTARNKVLEIYRKETRTKKYDIKKEVASVVSGGSSGAEYEPRGNDPSPSQYAQAKDLLDNLTRGKPAVVAHVLDLRQQGLTFDEIGERVGLSDRSVRRMLDDLKERAREASS